MTRTTSARRWAAVPGAALVGALALTAGVLTSDPATASLAPETTIELQVTGRAGVPDAATAVILNIAAVDPVGHGYVTAYPCGQPRPHASTLNYQPGVTVANNATVAIGDGGKVCLFTKAGTDLIADLNGWFVAHPEFTPRAPERLLDTRPDLRLAADGVVEVQVAGRSGVPADAEAAVLNIAAVEPGGPGYVTAYPCGAERPHASTINYIPGGTIANNAVVAIGEGGKVCLYSKAATDLIADLNGWYAGGPNYTARAPERLIDTRLSTSVAADTYVPVQITGLAGVPDDATAVVLNLGAVDPRGHGYVTAYPCGRPRPLASTINYRPDVTIANNATVAIGAEGKVCVYSKAEIDLIADVSGWYVGDDLFSARSPERLLDTRNPDVGSTTTTLPGGVTTTLPGGVTTTLPGGVTTTTSPGGATTTTSPGGGSTTLPGGTTTSTTLAPPPIDQPEFFEPFTGNAGLDRFVAWMYHRDSLLVAQTQWPGDHDENCGDASTQRVIPRSDSSKAVYVCEEHLMSAIGDTSGYSIAWFTPDADFDGQADTFTRGASAGDSTEVGWDVSVQNLGSRLWWEMIVVPEGASAFTTVDYLAETAQVEPYHAATIAVGNGPLGSDGAFFVDGQRRDPFGVDNLCDYDAEGCETRELRRRFAVTDNLDGTVTIDFLGTQYTYPGQFPEEFQVYFKAHAFTPTKDGVPPGYTWHWDNVLIQ